MMEKQSLRIIVDHRERPSGIIKELGKQGFDVEIKQLPVADFVVETKDKDGIIHSLGIEKKTQVDFLHSIMDKRLMQQLIRLKENFTIPLLVIEGSKNIYTLRNFHPNAIRGMLASIAIDFQVPIIYTKNVRDTASLIQVIAKRWDQPRRHVSLLKKRKPAELKDQQEFIVESLPGIGPNLAKGLLKKFKAVINVFNAKEEESKEVEKLGKKKSEEIRRVLDAKYKKK